ncbi:hypothetical protein GCM10009552_08110 [Rothia nasimurium]
MEIFRLVYWMKYVVPTLQNVDGYIFFDKDDIGSERIRAEALQGYASLREAQSWMNIILLDEFISEVAGDDWDVDEPLINQLLSIFQETWSFQIKARFPGVDFSIEKVVDNEYGDIGLRIAQPAPPLPME